MLVSAGGAPAFDGELSAVALRLTPRSWSSFSTVRPRSCALQSIEESIADARSGVDVSSTCISLQHVRCVAESPVRKPRSM